MGTDSAVKRYNESPFDMSNSRAGTPDKVEEYRLHRHKTEQIGRRRITHLHRVDAFILLSTYSVLMTNMQVQCT
jgi:hypothetical protein